MHLNLTNGFLSIYPEEFKSTYKLHMQKSDIYAAKLNYKINKYL